MKKSIIFGTVFTVLGLLIALGPKFIFRACSGDCACCGDIPQCFWSIQAEYGMGLIIAALGICLIFFSGPKIQLGLVIGVFLTGIIAILIPHVIIGGCESMSMACHRVTFPALTVLCALVLAGAVIHIFTVISGRNK